MTDTEVDCEHLLPCGKCDLSKEYCTEKTMVLPYKYVWDEPHFDPYITPWTNPYGVPWINPFAEPWITWNDDSSGGTFKYMKYGGE